MTLNEYLDHYLSYKDMLLFEALALVLAIVCVVVIALLASAGARKTKIKNATKRKIYKYEYVHNAIERFYEMIFSATSILSFLSVYYLIDRFVTTGEFRVFWDAHSDMLLLVLIVLSCVINTLLDKLFVRLRMITHEEKGSVRLMGMFYIILIFIYIKYIYENNNYDGFIMYFLGLMIGRFVYFDASFKDFVAALKGAMKNLPLLLVGLSYTGIMCLIGFTGKYLLKSNGVLVSTFFAHIFMIVAIFIVAHSHIVDLFVRRPKGYKAATKEDSAMDSDYDDESDCCDEDYDEEYENNDEEYEDYGEEYEDYDEEY